MKASKKAIIRVNSSGCKLIKGFGDKSMFDTAIILLWIEHLDKFN